MHVVLCLVVELVFCSTFSLSLSGTTSLMQETANEYVRRKRIIDNESVNLRMQDVEVSYVFCKM